MSQAKRFSKFEALGNDFVLLDHRNSEPDPGAEVIRLLADRHRGVGFDQLLIVKPATTDAADFAVSIFNQDGSPASQCGNGMRAIARWLEQQYPDRNAFVLATDAGLIATENHGTRGVRVAMGRPRFGPAAVGFNAGTDLETWTNQLPGLIGTGMVSMGNPHLILQLKQFPEPLTVEEQGRQIASCPGFSQGINVSFAWLDPDQTVQLKVYERGVGPTLACGSAACATAAFLIHSGQVRSPALIDQPGGRLVIDWRLGDDNLFMTGPARRVFDGILVE
ncbi:MAG: diaminopimelate epimerase [Wenzhouxiangella sp.]|nr:diaminopimelate epimerase [Wenzhouxiangella sp.]